MGLKFFENDNKFYSNGNIVVLGATGTGKNKRFIEPNLINIDSDANFIMVDIKGQTYKTLRGTLEHLGYHVFGIDVDDPIAFCRMVVETSTYGPDDKFCVFLLCNIVYEERAIHNLSININEFITLLTRRKINNKATYFIFDEFFIYCSKIRYFLNNRWEDCNDENLFFVFIMQSNAQRELAELSVEIDYIYSLGCVDIDSKEYFYNECDKIGFLSDDDINRLNKIMLARSSEAILIMKALEDNTIEQDAYLIGEKMDILVIDKLRELRVQRGLSQKELATLSGVSVRSIQEYEQNPGQIMKASVENVYALSKTLKCKIEDIL